MSERDEAVTLLQQSLTRCVAQMEQQTAGTGTTALQLEAQVATLRQQLEQTQRLLQLQDEQGGDWRQQLQTKVQGVCCQ